MTSFAGIYPMLYAFFDEHDVLDREAMRRQTAACVGNGAHGIAVLGLATEVAKLDDAERRCLLEWVAEDVAGAVPLAVTVFGSTVAEQRAFVRVARDAGASWVILQPPRDRGQSEAELIRFFGAVADAAELPVAVQNAPQYLGVGLSPEGLAALRRNHPNVVLLKGEASAVEIRALIEATHGELTVFNGRAGLELPDVLRAGCAGMIPSPDTFDGQCRIFELMASGRADDEQRAEALYRELLPAIVFIMQSIDTLLCYGKRIAAWRLGIGEVHDRQPALTPSRFGLACARRYARALGPMPWQDAR